MYNFIYSYYDQWFLFSIRFFSFCNLSFTLLTNSSSKFIKEVSGKGFSGHMIWILNSTAFISYIDIFRLKESQKF